MELSLTLSSQRKTGTDSPVDEASSDHRAGFCLHYPADEASSYHRAGFCLLLTIELILSSLLWPGVMPISLLGLP
ncbi:unnamed protein product [Boreogadus saida]